MNEPTAESFECDQPKQAFLRSNEPTSQEFIGSAVESVDPPAESGASVVRLASGVSKTYQFPATTGINITVSVVKESVEIKLIRLKDSYIVQKSANQGSEININQNDIVPPSEYSLVITGSGGGSNEYKLWTQPNFIVVG